MPRLSKAKLDEKEIAQLSAQFSYMVSTLQKGPEIEDFFNQFLTKEEKIMLSKRLVLFVMLERNYSPNVIQQVLKISYETVRLYTNYFQGKNDNFHKVIKKLVARQETQAFLRKVERVLKPLDLALRAKTDMKARAKLLSGDY